MSEISYINSDSGVITSVDLSGYTTGISFDYSHLDETYILSNNTQTTLGGLQFTIGEFYNRYIDVSTSNNHLYVLTDFVSISSNNIHKIEDEAVIKTTPILLFNDTYLTLDNRDILGASNGNALLFSGNILLTVLGEDEDFKINVTSTTNTNDATTFEVEFIDSTTLNIKSNGLYLTFNFTSDEIYFANKLTGNNASSQIFHYVRNIDSFILLAKNNDTSTVKLLGFNTTNNTIELYPAPTRSQPTPNNCVFKFNRFYDINFNKFNYSELFLFPQYDNKRNPYNFSIPNTQNNKNFQSIITTNLFSNGNNQSNILNLKNYQNKFSNSIFQDFIQGGTNILIEEFDCGPIIGVYSGSLLDGGNVINDTITDGFDGGVVFSDLQSGTGIDDLFFGGTTGYVNSSNKTYNSFYINENINYSELYYNSSYFSEVFPEGKTEFYVSNTNDTISIQESGFIESGAYSSSDIRFSDKIYKKMYAYDTSSSSDNNSIRFGDDTGTYFCSWLYNDGNTDIWIDRYYNPSLSADDISDEYNFYNEESSQPNFISSSQNIDGLDYVDVVSNPVQMTLDPSVSYIYERFGAEYALKFKQHSIENYAILDYSSIINYNNLNNVYPNYINEDYIETNKITKFSSYDCSNSFILNTDFESIKNDSVFSISLFAHSSDWNSLQGDLIIGDYFNGGWGLFNNNPILTPYLYFFDALSSSVFIYNIDTQLIDSFFIDRERFGFIRKVIRTSYDGDFFIQTEKTVGDSIETRILVYNNANAIKNVYVIDRQSLSIIDWVVHHYVENDGKSYHKIFVLYSDGKVYENTETELIPTNETLELSYGIESTSIPPQTIAVDYDGKLLYSNRIREGLIFADIDSKGNYYELTASDIFKNGNSILKAGQYQFSNFKIDSNNDCWVCYFNKIIKMKQGDSIAFTAEIVEADDRLDIDLYKRLTNDGIDEGIIVFDRVYNKIFKTSFDTLNDINTTDLSDIENLDTFLESRSVYNLSDLSDSVINLSQLSTNKLSNSYTPNLNSLNVWKMFDSGYSFQRINYTTKYPKDELCFKLKIKPKQNISNADSYFIRLNILKNELSKGWHHFMLQTDMYNGKIEAYVDGNLIESKTIYSNHYEIINKEIPIYLAVGSSLAKSVSLNEYIAQEGNYNFKGMLGDVILYNKYFTQAEIAVLYKSVLKKAYSALVWNYNSDIYLQGGIENIEQIYTNQVPPKLTNLIDVDIKGVNINSKEDITEAETYINGLISKYFSPNTKINTINWK